MDESIVLRIDAELRGALAAAPQFSAHEPRRAVLRLSSRDPAACRARRTA